MRTFMLLAGLGLLAGCGAPGAPVAQVPPPPAGLSASGEASIGVTSRL